MCILYSHHDTIWPERGIINMPIKSYEVRVSIQFHFIRVSMSNTFWRWQNDEHNTTRELKCKIWIWVLEKCIFFLSFRYLIFCFESLSSWKSFIAVIFFLVQKTFNTARDKNGAAEQRWRRPYRISVDGIGDWPKKPIAPKPVLEMYVGIHIVVSCE